MTGSLQHPTQGTLTLDQFLALLPAEKARLAVAVKTQYPELTGMPLDFSFDFSESNKTIDQMIVSPKAADIEVFIGKFNALGASVNDAIDSVADDDRRLSGFTNQFIQYDTIRNATSPTEAKSLLKAHGIEATIAEVTEQRDALVVAQAQINAELADARSKIPASDAKVEQAQQSYEKAATAALINYVGTELKLNDGRKFDGVLFRGVHNLAVMDKIDHSKSLVEQLQRDLQSLGYYKGDNQEADGVYGKGTVAAVAKFQTDNGLKPDGIAGKETIAAMQLLQAKKALVEKQADPEKESKEAALALQNFDGIIPPSLHALMSKAGIDYAADTGVITIVPNAKVEAAEIKR